MTSARPSDPTARWTPADLDARLEDFARTVAGGEPGGTVVPPDRTRTTAGDRALDVLRELAERPPDARLVLKETVLGRGGMSEVRLGVQVALDREVAVKRLPDDHPLPIARELVREARIVGRLEHPNVVPVHDLVIDESGAPMLVLERIEGQPWSAYLADAAKLAADHGVEDPLRFHLQVLVQVASALHHAHQRGIVHRDVKPDNVMIGALGQVYLVDWGIAVDLRPEALDAYDPSVLAGTPVYLAPEMVLGERVDARTDVYLLGATLYELLAGDPPHVAPTLRAIANRAVMSEPDPLPASVPFDLAAICRRCLSRERDGRYESADAVRRDLLRFLERRESLELARRSKKDLEKLEAMSREALALPPDQLIEDGPSLELQRLFGACRFGFEAARRAWPDNPEAQAGLERTTRAMLEIELARGNTRGATVLLAELENPTAELSARVAAAVAAAEAERHETRALAAFRRDLDPRVGRTSRFRATLLFAAFWIGSPLVQHFATDPARDSHARGLAMSLVFLSLVALVAVVFRRALFSTRYNKQILAAIAAIYAGELVFGVGQTLMQVDPVQASVMDLALRAVTLGMIAGFVDASFLVPALAYAGGYFAAAKLPELRFLVWATTNTIVAATVLWLWRPRGPSEPRAPRNSGPPSTKSPSATKMSQ
ncbi:MAG: serine/threonine protein kinase [Myxococcota bacterium]|nr:serine/threonine protein kinase [Myxococcota bacterium]